MADRLKLDRFSVAGRLMDVWTWADQNTTDGHARGVTKKVVDDCASQKGFADAMVFVGWLQVKKSGIVFPRWGRHCSKSAKERALAMERKRRQRHDGSVTQTGLEKRREEKIKKEGPIVPPSGTSEPRSGNATRGKKTPREAGTNPRTTGTNPRALGKNPRATKHIEAIYHAYPRKIGRGKALTAIRKALTKIEFESLLTAVQAYASNVAHKLRTDEERFIPHPSTWMNGERWADGPPVPEKRSWAERNAAAADSEASKGAPVASVARVGQRHHVNAPRSLKRQTPTKSQGATK